MNKVLNKKAVELIEIKKAINNPNGIDFSSIYNRLKAVGDLDSNIEKLVLDKFKSVDDLSKILLTKEEFLYTQEELKQMDKMNVLALYNVELENEFKNFTLEISNSNRLSVVKYVRMGKNYYKNFLGIDLPKLINDFKSKKYKYSNSNSYLSKANERAFDKENLDYEIKKFNKFTNSRLTIGLNKIVEEFYNEKLIPLYTSVKRISDKKAYLMVKKENDSLYSISLVINLDENSNADKNLKIIRKYLSAIDEKIDKHFAFSLYK